MKFPAPIQKGVLVDRYKRFLADIDLNGQTITAHCANPGSMMGLKVSGATVWVTPALNKTRKLKWDWQVIDVDGARVVINTNLANTIVEEAINAGQIPELKGYSTLSREVKYGGNCRIDILLESADRRSCYVEIKSVTLSRQSGLAEFPDSVTARGKKHLQELASMAANGHRAVMFYVINRTDCDHFDLARDIDPVYGQSFDAARKAGLEIICYACNITEDGLTLGLPVKCVA